VVYGERWPTATVPTVCRKRYKRALMVVMPEPKSAKGGPSSAAPKLLETLGPAMMMGTEKGGTWMVVVVEGISVLIETKTESSETKVLLAAER